MENTKEIRSVWYTDEFNLFYSELDERTKEKYKQGIDILKTIYVLSTKLVKKIVNTDLYKMRVSVGYNEYRTVLFATDHENVIQATNIILLSGFLKKSSKDYDKHVKRAINILKKLEL
ncbi:MAG: type II toxin-antitoxin system RelE/ParE family toxin [Dysgonamonadaceae bacterium]|nr:type II toxin-antitoxin system RelE/ParE family toxin [Dysgonamonadaceae bacterium]